METWFIIITSICIPAILKSIFNLLFPSNPTTNLPPGPPTIPMIGKFLWFRKTNLQVGVALRNLFNKYGPIVTVRIGSFPAIFVASHTITQDALIRNGAIFADRPQATPTIKILSRNRFSIGYSAYGPTWRLFRRNINDIVHPSNIKSYSHARKWGLEVLINRLGSSSGEVTFVINHFRYALYCLFVFICFGDKVSHDQMKDIEYVQYQFLLRAIRFKILDFWPRLGKIFFRRLWSKYWQLIKHQEDLLIPLIRARNEVKQKKLSKAKDGEEQEGKSVLSYVDTLLDAQLPEENRKLKEVEIVSLCSEFLNAGVDTTMSSMEWIMGNMVKYPHIQAKLYEEISGVVGKGAKEVKEEDLQKMPYLKAVILEGLRRHPPAQFVAPHTVTEEVTLGGYVVPKNATINFVIVQMGRDPKVWEDPMEFRPERFLNGDSGNAGGRETFDVTCSREIKMMPFGAGRRICPGWALGLLNLEYFIANLVWRFEWKAVDGDDVDLLSEKQASTVSMKNALRTHISPRLH